jgi:hypothetical protein
VVRCQIAQSLMAYLSVQTVNMCSKYFNVISRKSESLKPVTIESSLARHPVSSFKTMTSYLRSRREEGKHTHPGTRLGDWSELSRADCPYMPVDLLTLPDLGLPGPGTQMGYMASWTLESGFAHTFSYISKAVGLGKKMESWRNDHSGALLKKITFWFAKINSSSYISSHNMEEQQHHQTAATPSHVLRSLLSGLRLSIPTYQQNWWKPDGLSRWWPGIGRNSESFACRIGVKSSIVLCI